MGAPHIYGSTHISVYPTTMDLPTSICIPHIYVSTPLLCVYPTFMCLPISMGLHHVHVCTLIFTLISQLSTHVECENKGTLALVASQGLVNSWAQEWVFLWSNKFFVVQIFGFLNIMVCFMKIRERRRIHEKIINSGENVLFCRCVSLWYTPHLYVYPTYMSLPASMCLPNVYMSTPYTCVYPTSMCLPHIYGSIAYLWVYITSMRVL